MLYHSTRNKTRTEGVPFSEAVLQGLAPDGGLYLPEELNKLPATFFQDIEHHTNEEIAFAIAKCFTENEIPDNVLMQIVKETIEFPLPVAAITDNIYSLELFHGPTMAFKDVGARFMARVMSYFANQKGIPNVKVIVATSGDTGSAVAAGFYGLEGIEVYILYPQAKVSPLQEKQLTTWGGNIHAIEVKGSFDDCQALAKQLLADQELKKTSFLTSANSINIARLVPQSFYYALAYKELKKHNKLIAICVPSGNFGNICAGILLQQMGLPIHQFIAATNANQVVPNFLSTGTYEAQVSKSTISNAMDVGAPSNFERLFALFHEDVEQFRNIMISDWVSDEETANTLKRVYADHHYLLDPHAAVGYRVLDNFLQKNTNYVGVVLGTAHPAKFVEVVEDILQQKIDMPERLQAFARKEKVASLCEVNYDEVKEIIK